MTTINKTTALKNFVSTAVNDHADVAAAILTANQIRADYGTGADALNAYEEKAVTDTLKRVESAWNEILKIQALDRLYAMGKTSEMWREYLGTPSYVGISISLSKKTDRYEENPSKPKLISIDDLNEHWAGRATAAAELSGETTSLSPDALTVARSNEFNTQFDGVLEHVFAHVMDDHFNKHGEGKNIAFVDGKGDAVARTIHGIGYLQTELQYLVDALLPEDLKVNLRRKDVRQIESKIVDPSGKRVTNGIVNKKAKSKVLQSIFVDTVWCALIDGKYGAELSKSDTIVNGLEEKPADEKKAKKTTKKEKEAAAEATKEAAAK